MVQVFRNGFFSENIAKETEGKGSGLDKLIQQEQRHHRSQEMLQIVLRPGMDPGCLQKDKRDNTEAKGDGKRRSRGFDIFAESHPREKTGIIGKQDKTEERPQEKQIPPSVLRSKDTCEKIVQ